MLLHDRQPPRASYPGLALSTSLERADIVCLGSLLRTGWRECDLTMRLHEQAGLSVTLLQPEWFRGNCLPQAGWSPKESNQIDTRLG
jgi:hypothetical protein